MNKQDDWVVVGRFGRPHGVKGLISVISFTEPRENILNYVDWHTCVKNHLEPLTLDRVEVTNKSILVQIHSHQTREQVACLTNIEIAVHREQLPPLKQGEYYWHQLIGMQVVNQAGMLLGTVTEIMPTGSNDVLVVTGERRHLIPYLPGQFIMAMDQDTITVDWNVEF